MDLSTPGPADLASLVDVPPDPDHCVMDLGVLTTADAIPQTVARPWAWCRCGDQRGHPSRDLLVWTATITCVVGAVVVLPVEKVR